MADDLEKAKILLAWAARVYGPNEEANEDEYNRFLRIGCQIADIPWETLGRISTQDVVATMLAEDQQATAVEAPRKRGRPPTPHRHLWITYSIEAYIGVGLTRVGAIERAADKWALAESSVDEIYRVNKLPKAISGTIRDLFGHQKLDTAEDVDEEIKRFCDAERTARE
jgi:hypothetical protein